MQPATVGIMSLANTIHQVLISLSTLIQKILSDDGTNTAVAGTDAKTAENSGYFFCFRQFCFGECSTSSSVTEQQKATDNSTRSVCTRDFVTMNRSYLSTIVEESSSMITYDSWCPSSKRGLRFSPADEDEMQTRRNTANESEMEVKEIIIDSKIEEDGTTRLPCNNNSTLHGSSLNLAHDGIAADETASHRQDRDHPSIPYETSSSSHNSDDNITTFWPTNYLSVAISYEEGIYEELTQEGRQPDDTDNKALEKENADRDLCPLDNYNLRHSQSVNSSVIVQQRQQPVATDEMAAVVVSQPYSDPTKCESTDREANSKAKRTSSPTFFNLSRLLNRRGTKNCEEIKDTSSKLTAAGQMSSSYPETQLRP